MFGILVTLEGESEGWRDVLTCPSFMYFTSLPPFRGPGCGIDWGWRGRRSLSKSMPAVPSIHEAARNGASRDVE